MPQDGEAVVQNDVEGEAVGIAAGHPFGEDVGMVAGRPFGEEVPVGMAAGHPFGVGVVHGNSEEDLSRI